MEKAKDIREAVDEELRRDRLVDSPFLFNGAVCRVEEHVRRMPSKTRRRTIDPDYDPAIRVFLGCGLDAPFTIRRPRRPTVPWPIPGCLDRPPPPG
jgi:hypothetical protein